MPKKYRHYQIEALKRNWLSEGAIARQLGRDQATISVRATLSLR